MSAPVKAEESETNTFRLTDNPSIRTSDDISDHPLMQDPSVYKNVLTSMETSIATTLGEKDLIALYMRYIKDKEDEAT